MTFTLIVDRYTFEEEAIFESHLGDKVEAN